MNNEFFCLGLALFIILLFSWAFKRLADENWQFLAVIPDRKIDDTCWQGINFTYYGFFSASAYTLAATVAMVLLKSVHLHTLSIVSIMAGILLPCAIGAKVIARIVEKKAYTFSVGAASFLGILIAPVVILLVNAIGRNQTDVAGSQIIIVMAAVSIAYVVGEGVGGLTCISFGCCYGKPLKRFPLWIQHLFENRSLVFSGQTKKIAYADGLLGEKIFPVQAITAVIFSLTGVCGVYLFLNQRYAETFVGMVAVTQLWRFFSEFFRADYRGAGAISAYQWMGVLSIVCALALSWIFPIDTLPDIDLAAGLNALWGPGILLSLEGMWLSVFIYMGRSRVTASTVSFKVINEHI